MATVATVATATPRRAALHMAWRQFLMEGYLCEAASYLNNGAPLKAVCDTITCQSCESRRCVEIGNILPVMS